MLPTHRQQTILREIEVRGSLGVSEFAARLGVSGMTVRRDLLALEQEGLLERVHGGAVRRRSTTAARERNHIATIGLLVPSAAYYFPSEIAGAKQAAAALGVRLVLGITDYSAKLEREQIERLLAHGVDGLIVTPADTYAADSETYRQLADAAVPVIIMERALDDAPTDVLLGAVRTDHAHGARVAVSHLFETGRRRIALCVRPGPTAEPIREGYRRALQAHLPGTAPVEFEIARVEQSFEDQRESLGRVVEACVQQGIDGLIVLPDEVAITLLDLAVDRGIAVPQDLAFVAYDDEVASLGGVPMTAVSPPKGDVGATAVKACFDRIIAREREQRVPAGARIDLLPTLTVRDSSRPSRAD